MILYQLLLLSWGKDFLFYISHSDTKIMLFPLKMFIAYPSAKQDPSCWKMLVG